MVRRYKRRSGRRRKLGVTRRSGRRLKTFAGRKRAYGNVAAAAIGAATGMVTARYKRMRRGGSRTGVKRRRVIKDPAGYTQWEQHKFSKQLGRLTQRKMNQMGFQTTIYVWRSIARLSGNGNMFFQHDREAAPTRTTCPIYVWEINGTPNITSGGVISQFAPCYTLAKYSTGYRWDPVSGYQNDGATTDANWQVERTSGFSNAVEYPGSHSIMKWCEFKADLWGMKQQPTKFVVELCQFDEDVIPATQGGSIITDTGYNMFWDTEMRPYMYNPSFSAPGFGYTKKMKKVLDSRTFLINPTSSTESDADPHCKTIRFFWKLNRKCQYNWKDNNLAVVQGGATNSIETMLFRQAGGSNQIQVDPKARLYIMVKAAAWAAPTTTNDVNRCPSISAQVRVAHVTTN